MAAGIGSRYGNGIKQLAPVGPHGELIMDYSIRDAIDAGFDRVVFILRRDIEEEFRRVIGSRIDTMVETDYAFQELKDLPAGFLVPEGRVKPWGTGQAVLAARNILHEPFAVINADDYYGKTAYKKLHDYLAEENEETDSILPLCMAGFRLRNTLSEHGGVTRGICHVDDGKLTGVTETRNIFRTKEGAETRGTDGTVRRLDPDALVSMNMWGMTPTALEILAEGFKDFLTALPGEDSPQEYLLPEWVDGLIRTGRASVHVLESPDEWYGVTYQEDRAAVQEAFRRLTQAGEYPDGLYTADGGMNSEKR